MFGDSAWGFADAQVACRQLGLPTTGATSHSVYAVPDVTRVNWMSNVRCIGTEGNLFDCNFQSSENYFNIYRYAGVSCQDSKS